MSHIKFTRIHSIHCILLFSSIYSVLILSENLDSTTNHLHSKLHSKQLCILATTLATTTTLSNRSNRHILLYFPTLLFIFALQCSKHILVVVFDLLLLQFMLLHLLLFFSCCWIIHSSCSCWTCFCFAWYYISSSCSSCNHS